MKKDFNAFNSFTTFSPYNRTLKIPIVFIKGLQKMHKKKKKIARLVLIVEKYYAYR